MTALPKHYLNGALQLHHAIGQGAMGEVFLATLESLTQPPVMVAVKQVRSALLHRPEVIRTLEREARLGTWLTHPNLVKSLGLLRQGNQLFLVMEYVEGINLRELLTRRKEEQRPLPLDVVLEIALHVSRGLEHAHSACDERGVPLELVHRDLKPENILLSFQGEVKIGDFGLAKSALLVKSGLTLDGLLGTVAYMSPEQAGGGHVDRRSDLYALGSILFEMLTTERLYPEARGLRALDAVWRGELGERFLLLNGHSLAVQRLIEQLLERQPELRPNTTVEVTRQLTRLVPHFHRGSSLLAELLREDVGSDSGVTLYTNMQALSSITSTLPLP